MAEVNELVDKYGNSGYRIVLFRPMPTVPVYYTPEACTDGVWQTVTGFGHKNPHEAMETLGRYFRFMDKELARKERGIVPIDPTHTRPRPPSDAEVVSGPTHPSLPANLEADAGGAETP
jgi:hypothetical protein